MMQKRTSFKVVWDDLKISIRFAISNIGSFLLAMIGVLIVTGLLFILVFGILMIFLVIFAGGLPGLIQFFTDISTSFEVLDFGALGLGLLVLVPLISPLFVAIGALFGMGREIVESEGTSAEGVFTWYRRKFIPLAGGGIILFLITALPPVLGFTITYVIFGLSVPPLVNSILAGLTFVWIIIATGSLSMLFPAIIDGHSAVDATMLSIRLSWKYFDRVFSVWLGILSMILLVFIPIVAFPFATFNDPSGLASSGMWVAVYAVPAVFIVALVFIPAAAIALSRVYLILTATENHTQTDKDDTPGLSFVGGF